ncbi:MAG: penicillin-binding protein 2 [Verrucomicrobiota bacterium]|nr:penicillin-binding protein 2 [Verrucomicrobiota bacterium]
MNSRSRRGLAAVLITATATISVCRAQPEKDAAPAPPPPAPFDESIVPTYETQKLARTYTLDIPAPRGQIVDRNGAPLAQNKLSYNLAIAFPTPLEFSDEQILAFAHERIQAAEKLLGRPVKISDDLIKRHYRNRGILPLEVAQNLSSDEYDKTKSHLPAGMTLRPFYVRTYPQGKVAGQIVGYSGKTGRNPDGIIDNHEVLWPETEGREGLEQTFNQVLTGQHGQYQITFDKDGRKTSEKIVAPPVPGHTVVTTLDLHIQELAEQALEAKAKRGAVVVIDPNNGDILAMASWPTYNPNAFVPNISAEKFKALQDDPDIPLLPRAFRSSYPPGSTFKVAVGIAALESGTIRPDDEFSCTPSLQVGNVTFHNWKKTDRGSLNFVQALTESCDTWFYQVGIKTGADAILEWAAKLGFGAKTGIPLRGEVEGRLPNDQYMKATHGRKILNGDVANLSIGQGDVQVTPLQMAQAMGVIGNGGTLYQTRLVQHVQNVDNAIVTAFPVREKRTLGMSPTTVEELRRGMVDAVNGPAGTAHQASMSNVSVAGKTGTAQWGPKSKERTAAWFSGFAPADHPQYAFAALYEGDVGSKAHGGSAAAPMIARVLKDVYKGTQIANSERKRAHRAEPEAEPDEQTDDSDDSSD